ncbi:MAG TPA: hypothetical protein VLM05_10235 [Mycobacteriales bacterium]|nr:hypothetical protein [Mycobacteriales bacterium]
MVTGPAGINAPAEGEGALPADPADATTDPEVDAAWLAWLPGVLDTLLPPNRHLPAAGQMGLADAVLVDARWSPEFAQALRWLGAELPAGFGAGDETVRVEALRALEAAEPRRFATIVNLAYNAYYVQPDVLALIQSESGFTARPPQPLGYELEPFDPAVLATVSRRDPFWRAV